MGGKEGGGGIKKEKRRKGTDAGKGRPEQVDKKANTGRKVSMYAPAITCMHTGPVIPVENRQVG